MKDNTIFSEGALSNGAGQHMFAGLTAFGDSRRALIAFDVAGALPAGATVTSVQLTLHLSKTVSGPVPVELHRALQDWGEGASDAAGEEGRGIAAEPGDATWDFRFYDTDAWSAGGGDFAAAASAMALVGDLTEVGPHTWGSTPAMVADVQGWLDNPASNAGWLILGDESTASTAKRFDTREFPTSPERPALVVEFTPPPPCVPCDANCDGSINGFDVDPFVGLLTGGANPCSSCAGDVNGDGSVDGFDIDGFVDALLGAGC
ncbi:MAG: hypothetical protein CHACPFDD_00036 [Phycisphaerae bacterium]|nr:hypothetical protein [Phycisphaerae bacterium]